MLQPASRRLPLLFLVVSLIACSTQQPTHEVNLPSGKKVKVIAVGTMNFANDSPALMLKYQTDLKITDKATLRREVDEIWPVFKTEVGRPNLTNAIIRANETPKGTIIQTGAAYNFVFKKSPDGSWRCIDDEPSSQQAPEKKQ